MTEWWTMQTGTYLGAFGGGGIGALCGVLGACAGVLAPKGRGRRFVLGALGAMLAAGIVVLAAGVVALASGQPYHVYFPLVLTGGIVCGVMGPILPSIRARYAQAEQRRLDAESLRRA